MMAGGITGAELAAIIIPAVTGAVGIGTSVYGLANTPDAPKVKSPQPSAPPAMLQPGSGTISPFMSRSPLQNAQQRQSVAMSMLR